MIRNSARLSWVARCGTRAAKGMEGSFGRRGMATQEVGRSSGVEGRDYTEDTRLGYFNQRYQDTPQQSSNKPSPKPLANAASAPESQKSSAKDGHSALKQDEELKMK